MICKTVLDILPAVAMFSNSLSRISLCRSICWNKPILFMACVLYRARRLVFCKCKRFRVQFLRFAFDPPKKYPKEVLLEAESAPHEQASHDRHNDRCFRCCIVWICRQRGDAELVWRLKSNAQVWCARHGTIVKHRIIRAAGIQLLKKWSLWNSQSIHDSCSSCSRAPANRGSPESGKQRIAAAAE